MIKNENDKVSVGLPPTHINFLTLKLGLGSYIIHTCMFGSYDYIDDPVTLSHDQHNIVLKTRYCALRPSLAPGHLSFSSLFLLRVPIRKMLK